MAVTSSGEGAVGCFVSVMASLEAAVQACDITLTPEQVETQDAYRDMALTFYGNNVAPSVDIITIEELYAELVASEIAGAEPFCDAPDQFTTFADRLFAPEARAEIEEMMSVPRLPVANPCL